MVPHLQKRVVITGIGLVTPLGADRESSWQLLKSGATATRWLHDWEISQRPSAATPAPSHPSRMRAAGAPAAEFAGFGDPAGYDPVIRLVLRAAQEALADAGVPLDRVNRDRVGCVIGTSKGGLRSFSRALWAQRDSDPSESLSSLWMQFLPNAPAAMLSSTLDLRGPALCPVAACATGLASLARGVELVRSGMCDIVLAGSTDASLQESILASFRRLGVLARGFDDPATACRPFDRNRSGFLVGEGAAVFLCESLESALARNAQPYAEWVASGIRADGSDLMQLDRQALGLTRLIQDVLRQARLTGDEIDYINLHGTGTIQNDACETRAIKAALGPAAGGVRCSSIKGAIGHLLGAAGSVEMAATLLAMRDGVVPPTANLQEPDDDCDLDYTPRQARPHRIDNALKLSLGFGGHLVAALVRRI